jgi:hypothetical protein
MVSESMDIEEVLGGHDCLHSQHTLAKRRLASQWVSFGSNGWPRIALLGNGSRVRIRTHECFYRIIPPHSRQNSPPFISRRLEFEFYLENADLAPQSGCISNFCGVTRGPLEPFKLPPDQSHSNETGRLIQPGQAHWTRLELPLAPIRNCRRYGSQPVDRLLVSEGGFDPKRFGLC